TVGSWLKHEGEAVEAGESLVQLETEKVNVDVAADQAGVLGKIAHQEGETVHPGDVLAELDDAAPSGPASSAATTSTSSAPSLSTAPAPAPVTDVEQPVSATEMDRPHASPVARRLAEEHGV